MVTGHTSSLYLGDPSLDHDSVGAWLILQDVQQKLQDELEEGVEVSEPAAARVRHRGSYD